jgi:hypothetical protein
VNQARTSNPRVVCQKTNSFNDRGRPDDPVLRILRVGFRELNGTNRNLRTKGENLDLGSAFFDQRHGAHVDFDPRFSTSHAIFHKLIAERASDPDLRAARTTFLGFGESFSGARIAV